ncbi:MAG: cell division protein FtsQ/DivIB [Pseudomonadota bacterium]
MRSLIWTRKKAPTNDPAPSRLAWRIERWMMTPGIRFGLRVGVPFAATFLGAMIWLSDDTRRQSIEYAIAEFRHQIETRPEFMVNVMAVEGAGEEVAADIRDILPIDFPVSSFHLDLDQVRETIAGLDPVQKVDVRLRPGGVLEVHVTERVPVVVWRSYEQVSLVDATGAHVAEVKSRLARPDLPLIAGDGADLAVDEALDLIEAAAPLGNRLRGLVRMGERRWDVVLDRDMRILLPETGAKLALNRAIALDGVQELFSRDVRRVDLRLHDRPTVQVNTDATERLWEIMAQESASIMGQTE